jgi:predicted RNase H-like HicB family nuclease
MKYRVILVPSEDGFAVNCPALPGCWSQGRDEAEAIENIRTAIGEYLEVQAELLEKEARASGSTSLLREVDVATV